MRRWLTPSTIAPCVIVAAVAALVVAANIREGRTERPSGSTAAREAPGGFATSREALARRIEEMERRLAANPEDLRAAVSLADALVRQSRVTGNAGLAARGEQALTGALRADPGNYDALRVQASLLLSQHRFRDALVVAQKSQGERPADPVNYGAIGDAHLELGEYDAAFEAFDHMMQLRPSAASYARVAYARELQGDLEGALRSMTLAAEASGGADVEGAAWYRAQVGELYLRRGRAAEALQQFAAASHLFPGHPFAVAGYARALDAGGRRDEAIALLEDLITRSPSPDLYARLGEMLDRAGRHDDASREYALAEAAWRSDAPEPRNLARFLADRGEKIEEAVSLAEAAAADRHDIFTDDALAWAYFKAGRVADAKQAITRARRTGTVDVDILRHAAAIDAAVQASFGTTPVQMATR